MHGVSETSPKLEALRAHIQKIEGLPRVAEAVLPFGLADIDHALPWGGLPLACLHHVIGEDDALSARGFAPSAVTFVAALTARLKNRGTVLWCLPRYKAADTLYGPALDMLGLDEEALVIARAKDETSPVALC